jgi:hypothetical protein
VFTLSEGRDIAGLGGFAGEGPPTCEIFGLVIEVLATAVPPGGESFGAWLPVLGPLVDPPALLPQVSLKALCISLSDLDTWYLV